jgi:hypothetical protein
VFVVNILLCLQCKIGIGDDWSILVRSIIGIGDDWNILVRSIIGIGDDWNILVRSIIGIFRTRTIIYMKTI